MATEKKHVFNILSIDAKTVITDANPMPLVHSILYQRCTTGIGFASVITVLLSIKIQTQRSKFCWLKGFLVPHNRWICTRMHGARVICYFVNHLKRDPA